MTRMILLVFLFIMMPCTIRATEIQLQEETHSGTILGKEKDEIFFETRDGIINIRKADILAIDGKPYTYDAPKTSVPLPISQPSVPPSISQPPPEGVWYPEGITEQELLDYYETHREEFRTPLQVRVRSLGQAFFTRPQGEIRSDPTSEGGWRDGGWIEYGKTVEPFEESTLRPIFDMTVGGVSPLLKDKDGVGYLLWVIERKESVIPPYEEAQPKVLNKILQNRR